ncbi:MAG: peptide chain release factor 2 [Candidatus Caldatribacteriota bacterium]
MKLDCFFDLNKKEKEIKYLEKEMAGDSFWKDQDNSQKVIKRIKELKNIKENFDNLKNQWEEIGLLFELNQEEDEGEIWKEIQNKTDALEKEIEKKELIFLFTGKYDLNNAIVTIRPGAGGTESQDWAEMLLRMYLKWSEKKGFTTKIIEITAGEEAGIKNVTFIVDGDYAFGYLKAEKGIHRLVRISPFDANKRRHTSFASMEVIPEVDQDIDIEIKETDLRIDTYRATGAGGQHVNVTDSAVRIIHLPTNIVVQCQNERSQYSNKMTAMRILKARLFEYYSQEKEKELQKISGKKKEIAWGSQIRSYIFQPYQLVKDHRTGVESGNLQMIMDGEIDNFIEAYLKKYKS